MFGKSYVLEYCVKRFNNAQREEIYRIYISDTLRIISENTAKFVGGNYIKKRYYDFVKEPNGHTKNDNRSAKEIINDVVNKSGIKVVRSNGCVGPESDNNA